MERAFKPDILTILAVYHNKYFDTNEYINAWLPKFVVTIPNKKRGPIVILITKVLNNGFNPTILLLLKSQISLTKIICSLCSEHSTMAQ